MQAVLNIKGEVTESGELRVELPPETPRGKVVLTLISPNGEEPGDESIFTGEALEGQCVRVTGRLDAIRCHDHSFELLLTSGETLRGSAPALDLRQVRPLVDEMVVVSGRARFGDSEELQHLEADLIEQPSATDALWAKMPRPMFPKLNVEALLQPQDAGSGINAIRGKWPGDESDDEIFAALEELS